MATPFSTSRYPTTSRPTQNSGKIPRAPIHNPYDKFPKPEFDKWIGDITGALKRALRREPPQAQIRSTPEPLDPDEDVVEDSFAEVMARRAAKGKQRATEIDEDEMEAIEILTASEAEYSDEERGAIYGSGDDSDACGEEVSEGSEEGDAYEDEARSSPVPEVIEILSDDEEIEDTLPPLYSVDQRNGVDLDEEEYYDSGTDASDGDADSVEAEDGSEDERGEC